MNKLVMSIGKEKFTIDMYDNPESEALINQLPLTIPMSKWGGEFYGTIPHTIQANSKRQSFFKRGEVALWPDGNAFCIFFGPTPVSTDDRPKMASPGIPFGIINSESINSLDHLEDSISISLQVF